MSLRLCFILFLFTSPLYASCHNDVIDAAANASYVHKIQQVTASDRVYLYSAPNVQCRLNTFLVNGDPVQVFREATEYRDPHSTRHSVPQQYNYISFRDAQGLFVTGWVQASQLLDVTSPLNAPTGCQKQSDIAFQGQEALHVSHEKIIIRFLEQGMRGFTLPLRLSVSTRKYLLFQETEFQFNVR